MCLNYMNLLALGSFTTQGKGEEEACPDNEGLSKKGMAGELLSDDGQENTPNPVSRVSISHRKQQQKTKNI